MTIVQILFLALMQGITEFLPISSSGHLVLLPAMTGWADQGVALDVAVHVGTLLSVLLYFRRDVQGVALGGLASLGLSAARRAIEDTPYRGFFWGLVLASMPVIAVGFFLKSTGLVDVLRSTQTVALATIGFALLLWWVDRRSPADKAFDRVPLKPALLIGLAQIAALIPGASRAGVTMTASRALGYSRSESARFSMLLSIPVIAGAGILLTLDLIAQGDAVAWGPILTAAGASCLVALATIYWLMRWLAHASMTIFVLYRLALGGVLLVLINQGLIS